ncbi:MAG TPA: metallophosphoesterase, partial [bacterium]|nr:metallophosphoesterase [bacterium]
IGILSDSHDHVWNVRIAVEALSGNADVLVHCGDLCAPFIVPMLGAFPGPVHAVFGNNDADRYRLQLNAAKTDNVTLHGESFLGELGGKRIAVQHFDDLAPALAASGKFDLVCFGHNHVHEVRREGEAWLINPGAVLGWQPGGDVDPTFVVFDTESNAPVTWRIRDGRAAADPV